MINTLLNYKVVEVEDFTIENFTERKFISSTLRSKLDYYTYIEVEDNKKIEYISFDLYGTSQYWDVILVLNNMTDPLDLPKNINFIIEKAKKITDSYVAYYKISDNSTYEERYQYEYNLLEKDNEKNRMIMVVKPEQLVSFLRDFRKEN